MKTRTLFTFWFLFLSIFSCYAQSYSFIKTFLVNFYTSRRLWSKTATRCMHWYSKKRCPPNGWACACTLTTPAKARPLGFIHGPWILKPSSFEAKLCFANVWN